MSYVDGYVLAVPVDNKKTIEMANLAAGVVKEFGALEGVECWGDDVPEGKLTSFPMAVKCQPNEVVVFSWIRLSFRAVRDAGMAKTMSVPRLQAFRNGIYFDGKRKIYLGFL